MAGQPVRISILADADQATQGIEQVARAVTDTESRLDAAGRASGAFADKLDFAGGAAAKMAGGIGDVADGLAANGIISEEAAEKADQVAKAFMIVAGAADILTTASALAAAAQNAGGIAAARAAVASGVARAATLAQAAATRVATAAQAGFNAVFVANPIGAVVVAIVAVVAALVLLYRNSETARRIIDAAFRGIRDGAVAAFDGLKRVLSSIAGAIVGAFNSLLGLVGRMRSFGTDLLRGLIQGIEGGIAAVKAKLASLGKLIPDSIRKLLGIRSPSRVMARIGRDTMRGLTLGITSQVPVLERTLSRVSAKVASLSTTPTLALANPVNQPVLSTAVRPAGAATSTVINNTFNVPVGVDAAEVGRQVTAQIKAYERRTGQRLLAAA